MGVFDFKIVSFENSCQIDRHFVASLFVIGSPTANRPCFRGISELCLNCADSTSFDSLLSIARPTIF